MSLDLTSHFNFILGTDFNHIIALEIMNFINQEKLKYYQKKNKTNSQNSIAYWNHNLHVFCAMVIGKGMDTSATGYDSGSYPLLRGQGRTNTKSG